MSTCKPESGARWLLSFLKDVRVIYAFQHLSGTEKAGGDEALAVVSDAIKKSGEAIVQADSEGFYNEDGRLILWQLSDRVSGPWSMAVRQNNRWVRFEMDLGNRDRRAAFLDGRVPSGVTSA